MHRPGDIFVAEDGGNMELGILADVGGTTEVTAFCRIVDHGGSEVAGPAFSPDGTRLYLSSQRGPDGSTGYTYEITGPFRQGGGPPPPPPPPPPVTLFVSDAFSRTVSNGWGAADIGGPWALTGAASSYSVSGGAGRISVPAGSGRIASLGVSSTDAVVETAVAVDKVQTGGGAYVSVLGRRVNASNDYRLKLRFQSNGVVAVFLVRRVNGAETTLAWANSVGFTPGQFVRVKLRVSGTGPTSLAAKVWAAGAAEPAGWLLEQTDSTAGLQVAGGVAIEHYQSSSSTNGPVVSLIDTITAGSTSAPPPPPPNNVPLAAFTATPNGLDVGFDGRSSSDSDGTVAAWSWNFGDGTSGSGSTTTHTYAAGGTYNVSLTVTDDDGATGSSTQQVTVTAPPPPPPVTLFVSDAFSRTVSNGWGRRRHRWALGVDRSGEQLLRVGWRRADLGSRRLGPDGEPGGVLDGRGRGDRGGGRQGADGRRGLRLGARTPGQRQQRLPVEAALPVQRCGRRLPGAPGERRGDDVGVGQQRRVHAGPVRAR